MHSCWGLKAKRPIGEPGNRGAAGEQFTPGRGIRVQVIVSLTPWESQSLLQGAFPIPPDRLPQPVSGADQLGAALPLPGARRVPDSTVGTTSGGRVRGWRVWPPMVAREPDAESHIFPELAKCQ